MYGEALKKDVAYRVNLGKSGPLSSFFQLNLVPRLFWSFCHNKNYLMLLLIILVIFRTIQKVPKFCCFHELLHQSNPSQGGRTYPESGGKSGTSQVNLMYVEIKIISH